MTETATDRVCQVGTLPSKTCIELVAFVVVLSVSCARDFHVGERLDPTFELLGPHVEGEPYQMLREKWTVVLRSRGSAAKGGRPVVSLFQGGSLGGADRDMFPISVSATLMDPKVIGAGLRHYADFLDMNPEEAEGFRRRYYVNHNLENNILIEAKVQTDLAENYLNMKRWIVFLEDNCRTQYEPERIVERELQPEPEGMSGAKPGDSADEKPHFLYRNIHKKCVFIYFPRLDFYGKPIIHEGTKYLRIVFLMKDSPSSRAEGTWTFN